MSRAERGRRGPGCGSQAEHYTVGAGRPVVGGGKRQRGEGRELIWIRPAGWIGGSVAEAGGEGIEAELGGRGITGAGGFTNNGGEAAEGIEGRFEEGGDGVGDGDRGGFEAIEEGVAGGGEIGHLVKMEVGGDGGNGMKSAAEVAGGGAVGVA